MSPIDFDDQDLKGLLPVLNHVRVFLMIRDLVILLTSSIHWKHSNSLFTFAQFSRSSVIVSQSFSDATGLYPLIMLETLERLALIPLLLPSLSTMICGTTKELLPPAF